MSQARHLSHFLGALCLLFAAVATARSLIVPAEPAPFERVHLRQTVDSCVFAEDNVSVSYQREHDRIIVIQPPNACFAPGPPEVVDIQLGAFPPGEYRVEILLGADREPIEQIDFTVHSLVRPAIHPPPPLPLADYSGIWWTPAESGWGLSLHQGRSNTLAGALYVFGPEQEARWYTLQGGRWETSTRWSGEVFRSRGPDWSATWNGALVSHESVGTATLDFGMVPGREDQAELSYRIDGMLVVKTIVRLRF